VPTVSDVRVGIVGTGYIARHFMMTLDSHSGYSPARILTRRDPADISGFPEGVITNSIDDFVPNIDIAVEATGDPIWATEVVTTCVDANLPVVTMDTEFHITCGSAFASSGLVTEAEGDQPGSLAALHEDAVAMGFEPLVYGNLKGFFNPDPTLEEMEYWGEKQGFSIEKVTSFTDGTKVQAEQILVANHFGATIAKEGMIGADVESIDEGAELLAKAADKVGQPISDFVVSRGFPHGVFIVATQDERQAEALANVKMGPGPYYTLLKHDTFVHLEIFKAIRRMLETGKPLLTNSSAPTLSLAAVAKRDLSPGYRIGHTFGSFDLRGHAVRIADHPNHIPMGLLSSAVIEESLQRDEILTFEKVSVPNTSALEAWRVGHVQSTSAIQ
jgi:predicted homoserine dehydrogenase-like protein